MALAREAVIGCVLQRVCDVARVPHDLLRYAAYIYARAAQAAALDQHAPCTVLSRAIGNSDAAAAAADGEKIECFGHDVAGFLSAKAVQFAGPAAIPQDERVPIGADQGLHLHRG